MWVTGIVRQKKDTGKYNVFLDGEYAFALPMQDILYFKLKEGGEVSQETVRYIEENLIYIKAQDAALHFIGYKMRTVAQVRKKLMEKDFSEETIERVMAFLEKYKYVDDKEYCLKYVKEKLRIKPKSEFALKIELQQKGVCSKIIASAMEEMEINEEKDAFYWLEKKSRGQWPPENDKEKKRFQDFLLRKGYSYSVIQEAFSQMGQIYGGED